MPLEMFNTLHTPTLLVDRDRLARNIEAMQQVCDQHGVALWPHIKTHKMIEVAKMQLAAGAKGICCAKLGEAEVMLQSGVRRIFLAHSLVDPNQASRLRRLAESLDELVLAVTSVPQCEALDRILTKADLQLPVMLGLDSGSHREGVRSLEGAVHLAEFIRKSSRMRLKGIYAHEGEVNALQPGDVDDAIREIHSYLMRVRDAVDPSLEVWPGCSVTGARMAAMPGVTAVRPGTYVFGDLSLAIRQPVMDWNELALTVLTTVVDRPDENFALVDAGSKTFSGDKTAEGLSGIAYDRRDIKVSKCSEEHGWVTGSQVKELEVGERLRFVPAHVCTCVNMLDEVTVVSGNQVVDTWKVAARGKVQ